MHKALWLIPPLLGVAFYAAGSMAASREVSSARGADRVGDRAGMPGDRIVPAGASAEEMDQALEDRATAEWERIDTLNAEELKEMMPKLERRVVKAEWESPERIDLEGLLDEAAARLVKLEKGAGLAWLQKHFPGKTQKGMEGWAAVDPAGAFEAVVHSELATPCSDETLRGLLQGFAAQGPGPLREACLRVPWELFLGSPSSQYGPDLRFDSKQDVRPWIDSGVVPELMRRGVDCPEILEAWTYQYPREVLAQWRAGNELMVAHPELVTRMTPDLRFCRPEQEREVIAALNELTEEERVRLLELAGVEPGDPLHSDLKNESDPDGAEKLPDPEGQ